MRQRDLFGVRGGLWGGQGQGGQGGHIGDPLGSLGWFNASSNDSWGIPWGPRGPKNCHSILLFCLRALQTSVCAFSTLCSADNYLCNQQVLFIWSTTTIIIKTIISATIALYLEQTVLRCKWCLASLHCHMQSRDFHQIRHWGKSTLSSYRILNRMDIKSIKQWCSLCSFDFELK